MLGQRTRARTIVRRRGGRPRKTRLFKPRKSATPGFGGTRELRKVMVESPDRRGKYVEVTRNIRVSWSSTVRARTELHSAQEKAGDRFQCLYERRTSCNVLAAWRIRAKKRKKGQRSGSVPIRALMASKQLAEMQSCLGTRRFLVLELICGLGLTFQEAAQRYFGRSASREDEARLLELLLEALERLALHWSYAARDKPAD